MTVTFGILGYTRIELDEIEGLLLGPSAITCSGSSLIALHVCRSLEGTSTLSHTARKVVHAVPGDKPFQIVMNYMNRQSSNYLSWAMSQK